jgi:putative SOS response-associated peptidase YedK
MCGRFTLTYPDIETLAADLGVPVESLALYKARYNIAPTDDHFIVRMPHEDREVVPAKWGLVNFWAKDARGAARQINARAETVDRSPAFRDAFEKRRCVVPADGFYEWTGEKDARRPIRYHRADGRLTLFAGLYESWRPTPTEWQTTFTIITTSSNDLVAAVHDRMPVIISDELVDEWMYAGQKDFSLLRGMLVAPPNDLLVATPASQRVNSVKNDDPGLLVAENEAPPARDLRQRLTGI